MANDQRGSDRRDGNDAGYDGPERRKAERRATKPPVLEGDSGSPDLPQDGQEHPKRN